MVGRLRYQYEGGFWDEWFLTFDDDKPGWLVEDEGEYTFYVKTTAQGSLPSFDTVSVGNRVTIAGREVFITEKGHAEIAGGEGQLAFQILPGEKVDYVDGTSEDRLVSVEYTEDEIEAGFAQLTDGKFTLYSIVEGSYNRENNNVLSMARDSEGNIWMGTDEIGRAHV